MKKEPALKMSALSVILILTTYAVGASIVDPRSAHNQSPTTSLPAEALTLDLMCVCGKGGTCIDRSVKFTRIPTTSDECHCNLSAGFYRDCDVLINYCVIGNRKGTEGVCLNGGHCSSTFGSFYCTCGEGFIGRRCEYFLPNGVQSVTKPSTFHFIHTVSTKPKKLFLLAETLGTNFRAFVDFHDKRPHLVITERDFEYFELFKYCIETANEFPVAFDRDICYLYPQKAILAAIIEPSYSRSTYKHSRPGRNDLISVIYKNDRYATFQQNLSFFTPFYGIHEEIDLNKCEYFIVFRGCGVHFNTHRVYYAHETIEVTAVSMPLKLCGPITRHKGLWRYYPNNSDIYIEDEGERNEMKAFPPFTFDVGIRKIEYHNIVYGDRYRYGVSKEFVSVGECSVDIRRGRADLQFAGGHRRMYPCYEPIYLRIESDNPIFSWPDFEVTWMCNASIDNCKPKISLDVEIMYEPLECGQTYEFTAVLKSLYFVDSTATQVIQLTEEIPIFQILCVYNCLKIIQSTSSASFSTSMSILRDTRPIWRIEVDNETIIVKNRTDDTGLFIPGPLTFLKNKRIFRITAFLDNCESQLEVAVATPSFNGSCTVETNRVVIFKPFNLKCTCLGALPHVTFFVLDESAQVGNLGSITEPIAESNQVILFNLIVKHTGVYMLVLDPYWWEPIRLLNFKKPEVYKTDNLEPMKELGKAHRLMNQALYNGDHGEALEQISVAAFAAGFLNEELVTGRKIELVNTMKKLQFRHTLNVLAKMVAVLYRIGYLGVHGLKEENRDSGLYHYLMHGIAIVIKDLKNEFVALSGSPNQPQWYIGTRKTFITSVYRVCFNAMMIAYPEARYRAMKKNYNYPQFLYETSEGGHILLKIIQSFDPVAFPVRLYERPWVMVFQIFKAWFQVERMSQIETDMKKKNVTDFFIMRGKKDVRSWTIYCQLVRMANLGAWWISERHFVTDVITLTVFDYETKSALNFPINIARFSINLTEIFSTEGSKVHGVTRHDDEKKDRSLVVWQYHIPSSWTGMLFVTFEPFSAERKLFLKLNQFPSYDDVYDQTIDRTDIVRSVSIDEPATSPKRDQVYIAVLPNGNISGNSSMSYKLHAFFLSCLTYGNQEWKNGECKLGFNRTAHEIKCVCPRISWHAVEKVILQGRQLLSGDNEIEIGVVKNYTVLVAMVATITFIIIVFIWSIFMDRKKDVMDVVYLLDSTQGGFVYLISVSTGRQFGAGSDSSIGFHLIGSRGRCGPHLFRERRTKRRLLTTKDNFYLVATPVHLGELLRIDVWNDFTGVLPDWYCQQINVYDLGHQEVVEFDAGFWLSRCTDDLPGLVSVKKPVEEEFQAGWAEERECRKLGTFITNQLLEKHRWVSTFCMSKRNIYQHKEKALILASFILVVMGFAMIFSTIFAGGLLDSSGYNFGEKEALIAALSLITAYFEYFFLTLFLEKSNEFTKRFRPTGTIIFTYAQNYKTKRQRSFESRNVTLRKFTPKGKYMSKFQKLWWCHVYSPSNFLTSFSAGNIRQSCRPKINAWLYTSWIFAGSVMSFILVSLFIFGFNLGRFRSYQWLAMCGCALIVDALIVDPLRIAVVTACLFFVSQRRALDNYQIHGYFECRIKEEQKMNYYKELGHVVFQPGKNILMPRQKLIKIILRFWLSRWHTLCMMLVLLVLLYYTVRIFDVRVQFFGNRNAGNLVSEPLALSSNPNVLLNDVKNSSLLVSYLNLTLLPNLHRQYWYNGKLLPHGVTSRMFHPSLKALPAIKMCLGKTAAYSYAVNVSDPWDVDENVRGWSADCGKKLIKATLMIQTRIRLDSVTKSYFWSRLGNITESRTYVAETRNFSKKWEPFDAFAVEDRAWMYVDDYGIAPATWSIMKNPISGYILSLPPRLADKKRQILLMQYSGWLDNCTRTVEVAFNIYDLSNDLATASRIVFRVSPGGYYDGQARSQTTYVSIHGRRLFKFLFLFYIAMSFVLWSVLRIWFLLERGGCRCYKRETYSILDSIILVSCIFIIIMQGLVIARFHFVSLEWERVGRFDYYKLFETWNYEPCINFALVFSSLMLFHCFLVFIDQFRTKDSLKLNCFHFRKGLRILLAAFLFQLFLYESARCSFFIGSPSPRALYYSVLKDFDTVQMGFFNGTSANEILFASILFILNRLFGLASFYVRCEMHFQALGRVSRPVELFPTQVNYNRVGRIHSAILPAEDRKTDERRATNLLWGFFHGKTPTQDRVRPE